MTRLRASDSIDPKFLAIQLHTIWGRGFFRSLCTKHVNQASVSTQPLLDVEVAVPPLAEQRRIVAAIEEQFSRLDAVDETLGNGLLRIEGLRRAVLNASLSQLRETRPLNEVASTQLGKMLSSKARSGVDPRPYLQGIRTYAGTASLSTTFSRWTSTRQNASSSRWRLETCSFARAERSVGRPSGGGEIEDCYFQKAIHRVRTTSELEPSFLVYVLRWFADTSAYERYVTGSTINHLPQDDLAHSPSQRHRSVNSAASCKTSSSSSR